MTCLGRFQILEILLLLTLLQKRTYPSSMYLTTFLSLRRSGSVSSPLRVKWVPDLALFSAALSILYTHARQGSNSKSLPAPNFGQLRKFGQGPHFGFYCPPHLLIPPLCVSFTL